MYPNSNRHSHSQYNYGAYNPPDYKSSTPIYDDHERLNFELVEKVHGLRSLSIKIGDELRSQNNLLGDMAGTFDHSEGVLRSTMSRLSRMAKQNLSSSLYCYLIIFVCIIFFMCWFILRFY
ncbi:unnamed protein product [Trichobilharzia regenti]|uniref:t-SNARE coiled-coil homology domain-containing protein n=1 Tax=Trichobilharzia regenti TaxID=157069 RepID=A0A183VIE9_TRIRE|nr:unnamed protein product [Trichobilharzia regenti]CAH8833843.1 unnamed protein product [Trichobilharzia regenti]VDP97025.1 unnamed protein product [Trichobilharzia regenti]